MPGLQHNKPIPILGCQSTNSPSLLCRCPILRRLLLASADRLKLEFRAEGFNIFNHHNFYVNALTLDGASFAGTPLTVTALKGGLGTNNVSGTNHDERRFGQFA